MDEKARIKAIDAALAHLRRQLVDRVPVMPDHRDGIEIGWLLANVINVAVFILKCWLLVFVEAPEVAPCC